MESHIHAGLSWPLPPAAEPFMVHCCGGQGQENQWSPDQDLTRGWHPWMPHEMWAHCHSLWHSLCKWFWASNHCCPAEILLKPGALQSPASNPECNFMQWIKASMWISVYQSGGAPLTRHRPLNAMILLGCHFFFSYFPFPACFLVVFSSICDYSVFNLPVSFHKISSMWIIPTFPSPDTREMRKSVKKSQFWDFIFFFNLCL